MRKTGRYEQLGEIKYFIPDPLPPQNPPFEMGTEVTVLYGEVMLAIGNLNEIAIRLPDIERFMKTYLVKEALLSSAIEGINTTLLEVFTQPLLDSKPSKNIQLVMNYTKALNAALTMAKDFPISSRVLLRAHKTLLEEGENDKADPGNYRKQGVRVGNLVPAPAKEVPQLISALEIYINTDTTLPLLIRAGLAHVQFETIHPFLDGNGRIGRLLIILMLSEEGFLTKPVLYPSYYFKKYQLEYYQRLDRVRTDGDFEGWITFYLNVMKKSCLDAYQRAKEIETLHNELQKRIADANLPRKKQRDIASEALNVIFESPIMTAKKLSLQLDVAYNTANRIITDFVTLGILVEISEQKRGKLFKFNPYFDVLEKEYDL